VTPFAKKSSTAYKLKVITTPKWVCLYTVALANLAKIIGSKGPALFILSIIVR
jgi:hypothetical protein